MVRPHRVRGTESDSRAAGCSAGAGARTVPGGQSQEGGGQPAGAAPHGEAKKEALPSQNSSSRFPKPARYSAHFRKKSVWPFCRLWNTCGEGGAR